MTKTSKILLLVCAVITTNSYALQTKVLANNQSAAAIVSAKELSHIFVDGDRIQSVRGLDGKYTVKNDNVNGEIYIRPTTGYRTIPFNVFITTEQGRTFTLLLVPMLVPAENIEIKPKGGSKKVANHWEMSSSYETTLTSLIISMIANTPPEGYEVTDVQMTKSSKKGKKTKKSFLYLGNIAKLELQAIYSGANLQGEIYKVTNLKQAPIVITESEFYRTGTRAVALQNEVIKVGHSTLLYVVMSNG